VNRVESILFEITPQKERERQKAYRGFFPHRMKKKKRGKKKDRPEDNREEK